MRKLILLLVLQCLYLAACAQETETPEFKPVQTPKGFTTQLNTVYTKVGTWEGRMDLYLPPNEGKPTPVVVNIHGGAWVRGSKESQGGFNTFFKQGFAVANIAYRLAADGKAPGAVEDARCALVYLMNNAEQLNIDPNKIVMMGGSAGGHLALLAGLLENDKTFDKNCPTSKTVKVAAIIDKYGPTDLTLLANTKLGKGSAALWLGDKKDHFFFLQSISPITYVKKTSPPVFIIHGTADPTVPYKQSVDLHKKLEKAGVKTKFITVEGGEHGKFPKEKNDEINAEIVAFLKEIGVTKE